ncbi:TPA: hypothetical protein EYP70_06190, partial [Candidatus Bathyarchaeota archaeon]|nr:hypothetical protein [Candidatus Bathyarchaeota archaeon]
MSLRSFLKDLEGRGDLVRVEEKSSTRFDVAYILRELADGPALLFENVEGFNVEIVGNVVSTRKRIYASLGASQASFYKRMLDAYRGFSYPKIVREAPVMEVTEQPNLLKIPGLTH